MNTPFRRILPLLGFLTALFLLAGCRSSKRAARESAEQVQPGSAVETSDETGKNKAKQSLVVSLLNQNRQSVRGIRGKTDLSLQVGGKKLSASGTLKMKRDEIIQLSVTAFGLLEIARLELTPEYLFIQDRYNKRYLKESWSKIPSLKQAGIDFNAFQSLFWNELYVPGRTGIPSDNDYTQRRIGDKVCLQPKVEQKLVECLFVTNDDRNLLQQTTLTTSNKKFRFDGLCQAWSQLNGKQFPSILLLSINSGSTSYAAEFTFTRLQTDEQMGSIASSVPEGRYTRMNLDEILKQIVH